MSNVNALNTDVSAVVSGPGSSTDTAIARFNGTGGKTIENSTVTIDNTGNVTLPASTRVLAPVLNATTTLVAGGGFAGNVNVVTSTPYNMLTTDFVVEVNVGSAATVNLPTPTTGGIYTIKDSSGAAATNNITISGSPKTIDGASSYVLNINYGSVEVTYNGSQWNVISGFNTGTAGTITTTAALTAGNDTNVTLTTGGSASTALVNAASITAGWTGTLSPARGGTGVNNSSNSITLAGNLVTAGANSLTFNTTGTTSVTLPTSGTLATTSQLPTLPLTVPNGGTGVATLTAHGVLLGEGASNVSATSAGTSGQLLQSGGASVDPTWTTATYPTTAGTSGNIVTSNGTNFISAAPTNVGTVTQFDVLVGGSGGAIASVGPGSSGQVLQSAGNASNPAYSTATYPATAGTSGKVLISDGTNIVSSTPTFPNASASSGKFIRSDGTNWIASTPTLPTTAGTSGTIITSDGTNFVNTTATYPSTVSTSGNVMCNNGTNFINTRTLNIDSSNRVTNANQPAFTGVRITSVQNITNASQTTIVFNSNSSNGGFDQASNYNTGTGVFTAPVAGIYYFWTLLLVNLTASTTQVIININSSTTYTDYRVVQQTFSASTAQTAFGGSAIMKLNASETVSVLGTFTGNIGTVVINSNFSFFSGHLMC